MKLKEHGIHIGDYTISLFPEYKKTEFRRDSFFSEWMFCIKGLIWISKVKPQWRVKS